METFSISTAGFAGSRSVSVALLDASIFLAGVDGMMSPSGRDKHKIVIVGLMQAHRYCACNIRLLKHVLSRKGMRIPVSCMDIHAGRTGFNMCSGPACMTSMPPCKYHFNRDHRTILDDKASL
ncbi:hypothetical protein NAC44_08470 [Allorhizobium sp. BGMRC 0089]|nr:hypothetical protein [Allorhizobium sonneratiae]